MESFLLNSSLAQSLYDAIKTCPIIDFHTHLSQAEILEDKRFANLWELWLKNDHYKWRLMRACGVKESLITGNASAHDKYLAFASILPLAIGNPVYQWAHMELQQIFGVNRLLNKNSAPEIWELANNQLQNDPGFSVRGLLKKFNVRVVCTTDDPASDLSDHLALQDFEIGVFPTFRPDRFCAVDRPDVFKQAIAELCLSTKSTILDFASLLEALRQRHAAFGRAGCRLSDHGLPHCPTINLARSELDNIFSSVIAGNSASKSQWDGFTNAILKSVAAWNTESNWAMQLHLGPQRDVNSSMSKLGSDFGFDTMGPWLQTEPLISFLDQLATEQKLPRTIVYNLNPMESESICCALQNFQDNSSAGKIQYGPAWWHCDHVRGITEQLEILMSLSAIGTSVGMLTDSRSFTSYVRHDYYRRILCNLFADQAKSGAIPNDTELLVSTLENIAFRNAKRYFNFPQQATL